ncbi:MAG: hypothetical protein GC150_09515 [Rhizobiales bacterium]|nr:hypothetical protein [Hyphomicrobiales bacterium]
MSAATTRNGREFQLTGRHVLYAFIAFFGVMMGANGVFLYYAISTFTGVETSDAYRKGLAYDTRIAEARLADGLGWGAALSREGDRLVVTVRKSDGGPVSGLLLEASVGRGPTDRFDASIGFEETDLGRYESQPIVLAAGSWIVAVEGRPAGQGADAASLKLKERLWISQ